MNIQFPTNKKSITLIGMAGAGKSFIGRNLAQELDFLFIDTDDLIEQKSGKSLQQILDQQGDKNFIKIESENIIDLGNIQNKIISPGGSVVYSDLAMEFLKTNSVVVYLADSYEHIFSRVKNLKTRGIVGLKNKNFQQLFNERSKLYQKYADFTIDMSGLPTEDKFKKAKLVIAQIKIKLTKLSPSLTNPNK